MVLLQSQQEVSAKGNCWAVRDCALQWSIGGAQGLSDAVG